MDYKKMNDLKNDPERLRQEAKKVYERLGQELNKSSRSYLGYLMEYDGQVILSVSQLEYFNYLREKSTRCSVVGGYKAHDLIQNAYCNRLDLNDESREQWLSDLVRYGQSVTLSNSQWRTLFSICRELDLIGPDWINLNY